MNRGKMIALTGMGLLAAAFLALGGGEVFSLAALKAGQTELMAFRDASPLAAGAAYMAAYVVLAALSLPGAAVMTVAGGAVFGLPLGTVLASLSSTLGATLAFLASRFLFRDRIGNRFGERLENIDAGFRRDGPFYLFMLRLVPAVPFFLVNLGMGLMPIQTRLFALVSLIGMLPGTIVYVNAGNSLGRLDGVEGIVSPDILAAFALLGIFPLLARKAGRLVKQWKDSKQETPCPTDR